MKKIVEKYIILILAIVMSVTVEAATSVVSSKGDSLAKVELNKVMAQLDDSSLFRSQLNEIDAKQGCKAELYAELKLQVLEILDIQEQLVWINPINIRKAYKDFAKSDKYDKEKYGALLSELETACRVGYGAMYSGNCSAINNAKKIIEVASTILKSNPELDFDKIIVAKYNLGDKARSVMAPALGTERNNWSNQMTASKKGFDAEISEVSSLRAEQNFRTIYKAKDGAPINHFQLHWDAEKMMFTTVDDRGLWNMFEVGVDGSGVHKLIDNPEEDLEFVDGSYLPDGRILAITNIGYQGVPCVHGSDAVGNMSIYDPTTKSLRRTTFDQDANWNPVVMNNGRVMYVRWEYTDLTHYFSRIVMHANPDGTETKALYGSGSFFPNSTFDIRPLPGRGTQFVGVVSGHHGVARSGRMMLFDPAKGRKEISGIVQEFPFSTRAIDPIIKDRLVDGVWPQFIKPYPINEKYYLVSAKLSPSSLWSIYLVDIYDNMIPLIEGEGLGFTSPTVVEKRVTPPVIPDKVDLTKKNGTIFIQDIYEGEGLLDVPRGTVKKLRLFAYEYAYIKSPSDHHAQGIQSGWDIKRILGEVDVEEDGSAIFNVPANTPISIQPLDSEGRAIQWMRSWTTAMPGEVVSCVGCHEDQNSVVTPKRVIASMKAPSELDAPKDGVRPFLFALEVQPILNRACVSCHDGSGSLNMTGELKPTYKKPIDQQKKMVRYSLNEEELEEYLGYTEGYLAIHPFVSRQGPEADAWVMKPYEYHASTSELVKILKAGHHGVELTDKEWRKLYEWIDLNAPFHSSFTQLDYRGINQIDRRRELSKKYNNVDVNWEKEIEDYTKIIASRGDIVAERPQKEEKSYTNIVKAKGWPIDPAKAVAMQEEFDDNIKKVEIAEGVTLVFRKVPSGAFVMGSNSYGRQAAPEHKVKIDKAFWIGEIEITQEQFNVVFPEHDNRYLAQMWKDHTGPGYAANKPEYPVIRVSWEEAMEYCEELSKKTGLKITLPTEAQWEWACRAGSNDDFWYGNNNSNFGKYENLADVQLEKMAVNGVNPQPMHKNNKWFKYWNFLPKVATVDDGNMLIAEGKMYKANPWNLYDMHGNVGEWTRSSYDVYPFNAKKDADLDTKTIKGGNWLSRPKNAGAAYREGYYKWQKANNVGFRLVINE